MKMILEVIPLAWKIIRLKPLFLLGIFSDENISVLSMRFKTGFLTT